MGTKPVIKPGILKPGLRKKSSLGGGDSDGANDDALDECPPSMRDMAVAPTTYIVAQTPEVLSRLMRENKGGNAPGCYNTPAAPMNMMTVAFDGDAPPIIPGVNSPALTDPLQQPKPVTTASQAAATSCRLASLASGYGYSGFALAPKDEPEDKMEQDCLGTSEQNVNSAVSVITGAAYGYCRRDSLTSDQQQPMASSLGSGPNDVYVASNVSCRSAVGYGGVVGVGGMSQSAIASAATAKNYLINPCSNSNFATNSVLLNSTSSSGTNNFAPNFTAMSNSIECSLTAPPLDDSLTSTSFGSTGSYGSLPHYHQYQKQMQPQHQFQQQHMSSHSTLPHSPHSTPSRTSNVQLPYSIPAYPQAYPQSSSRRESYSSVYGQNQQHVAAFESSQPIYDGVLGLPGGPNPPYAQFKSQMSAYSRSQQRQPDVMDQQRAFMQYQPQQLPQSQFQAIQSHFQSLAHSLPMYPGSVATAASDVTGSPSKSNSLRRGMRSVGSTLEREHGRVASASSTLERGRSAGGTLERGASVGGTLERGRSPGGTLERGRSPCSTLERGRSVGGTLERTRSPAGTLERDRGRVGSASGTLERGNSVLSNTVERKSSGGDKSGSGSPYYSPNTTMQHKVGIQPYSSARKMHNSPPLPPPDLPNDRSLTPF